MPKNLHFTAVSLKQNKSRSWRNLTNLCHQTGIVLGPSQQDILTRIVMGDESWVSQVITNHC